MMGNAANRSYIFDENKFWLEYYIRENFDARDHADIAQQAWDYPGIFSFIIDSQKQDNAEKWDKIIDHFTGKKPPLGVLLGDVGSGKDGLLSSLIDKIHKRYGDAKPIAAIQMENMPDFVKIVDSPEQAVPGSLILMTEGGVVTSARESGTRTNKHFVKWLQIRRHSDLGLIVASQHPKLPDITYLRLSTSLLLKPMPSSMVVEKNVELSVSDLENLTVLETLIRMIPLKKQKDGWSKEFIFTDYETGFKAENSIPKWFTETVSKHYSKLDPMGAWKMASNAVVKKTDLKAVAKVLALRGISWTSTDVKYYGGLSEKKFKKEYGV